MKVDHALILAAGKGTRMGKIGEILPKVLWPVFEKSILELEVLYAKKLGAQKVHTNLYNHKQKVQNHLSQNNVFNQVNILEEPDAIDIGGAIHNLANQLNYKGTLLVLNSDQFIMFDDSIFSNAHKHLITSDMVLFTYDVNSNQQYNELVVDSENFLKEIRSNEYLDRDVYHQTYTGMALIKLDSLDKKSGLSKFFDSVANPNKKKVKCVNIKNSVYWDFGTTKRYHESLFKLLEMIESKDPFVEFLVDVSALDKTKINGSSYFTESKNAINLSEANMAIGNQSIVLAASRHNRDDLDTCECSIVYNEIIQPVDPKDG